MDLNINISIALGEHSTIFQCECVAIIHAARAVLDREVKDSGIRILSDSKAVLQALDSASITSSLIQECHLLLQRIAVSNNVILQWIKGHSGSMGNDAADELARRGSQMPAIGPGPQLPLTFSTFRSWLRQCTLDTHNARWINSTSCRQSKEAIPALSGSLSRKLLRLNRINLRLIVGIMTGHSPLNRHL
ncbi:ribonuclease H family protein, partial [Listeria welshimeri]|uniref:ribonuclease H family protein n=1 Tax=Listeria welshimeri TaxID=1643 RepID=UPI0034D1E61E